MEAMGSDMDAGSGADSVDQVPAMEGAWPASVLRHWPEAARRQPSQPVGLLQRILLTTDGTVSHVLEAFTGEPVEVVKLAQDVEPAGHEEPDLELHRHETVIRRTIVLRTTWTGRPLLHGTSVIAHDRIGTAIRNGLLGTDEAIGRLLFANQVETFREMLGWGEEPAGSFAPALELEPVEPVLFRTYRILSGGRPVMLVSERFSARLVVDLRATASPESVSAAVSGLPRG